MTMAGKVVLATCLGVLASMGASFMCVAPLQARGSLVKSGWLSSGRVVAATSPRREVSLQATRTRTYLVGRSSDAPQEYALAYT